MAGYVYILSNPAMPGFLKIGKTKNDPADRAKSLTSATGVPFPFEVEFAVHTPDMDWLESETHLALSRYRGNRNREFFVVDLAIAIKAIERLAPKAKRWRQKRNRKTKSSSSRRTLPKHSSFPGKAKNKQNRKNSKSGCGCLVSALVVIGFLLISNYGSQDSDSHVQKEKLSQIRAVKGRSDEENRRLRELKAEERAKESSIRRQVSEAAIRETENRKDQESVQEDTMETQGKEIDEKPDSATDTTQFRSWSTPDGKYTVVAKYISGITDSVILQKKDGTEITVPTARLCDKDIEYIEKANQQENSLIEDGQSG